MNIDKLKETVGKSMIDTLSKILSIVKEENAEDIPTEFTLSIPGEDHIVKLKYTCEIVDPDEEPEFGEWIPVKYHQITKEEREEESYPDSWEVILDGRMPQDGDNILISIGDTVSEDVCIASMDEYALESGTDWVDVDAWMPFPCPYKGGELSVRD